MESNHPNDHLPIFKLNEDLLFAIFYQNASLNNHAGTMRTDRTYEENLDTNGFTSRVLNTLRLSSQTCQSWRRIIINTSSLWGKAVDLDLIVVGKPEWGEEVVRRTGKALLDVRGSIQYDSPRGAPNSAPLLEAILRGHWPRMRTFYINIFGVNRMDPSIWLAIHQPAKYLELFHLNAYNRGESTFEVTDGLLFAGDAPVLQHFSASHDMFSLKCPWLRQLRHLTIDMAGFGGQDFFSLLQFLLILPELSLLEAFLLDSDASLWSSDQPGIDALANFTLPRLRFLSLRGRMNGCAALLKCLTPGVGCSLQLSLTNHVSDNIDDLQEPLRRYSNDFFKNHVATSLYVNYSDDEVEIRHSRTSYLLPPWHTYYSDFEDLEIEIDTTSSTCSDVMHTALRSMLSSPLHSIQDLHLTESSKTSPLDPDHPDFVSFILKFSSVEVLYINQEMLHTLFDIESPSGPIFPKLRELTVQVENRIDSFPLNYFLHRRIKEGVPIEQAYVERRVCDDEDN